MKDSKRIIAALAAVLVIACPGHAGAQLLLDQFSGNSVGAATELGSAAKNPLEIGALMQRLQQQGYSNVNISPTDPHQFTATSPTGTPVIVTVEPMTGQVLAVTPQP